MDKLILKKIAKRFCKGVLEMSEASIHFEDRLTQQECEFIQEEIQKIADRITQEAGAVTTEELVKEYYEFAKP